MNFLGLWHVFQHVPGPLVMLDPMARRLPAMISLALLALACVQIQAPLPLAREVAPGAAQPIDGVWRSDDGGAAFEIAGGRVIAKDVVSDGFFRVDPGMVVAVEILQRGPFEFEGRELAFGGRWLAELEPDGVLHVRIFRPLNVVELVLIPIELVNRRWFEAQLASDRVVRAAALAVPPVRLPSASRETTSANPESFGRYFALVVGNDAYRHLRPLRTAGRDASAIAELLESKYGFEVERLADATREDVLDALRGLRSRLSASDNLLIYYAGHGWLDEAADEGYWLPVDATRESEVNWIAHSTISAYLKAIRAKHILVVADSCYAGKLTRGIRVVHRTPSHLEVLARKRARVVLTSGGLEPVDDAGRGDHSAFAAALLDALSENDGILDTGSLYARIRRPVMLASDQTPELADIRRAGHEGGDFLFVPVR